MSIETERQGERLLLKNDFYLKQVSGKFVAASVFSMLFIYAGSLIDTMLVGFFLGEDGLAAMSLVSPIYLVYYTFGATVGIGGSIVASRMIGRGRYEEYRKLFSCTAALMVIVCAVLTVLGYLLLTPISAKLAGASGQQKPVEDYLRFYIPGGGATLLAYIPLYFLKTDGKPKTSSVLFFFSAALNTLMTWLFMSPLCNMGIGGASLATSISMGATAVIGTVILLKNSAELRLVRNSITGERVRSILFAGTPNGLSNLLESARILFVNMLLLQIGAAALLPSYTVVRNTMDMLSSVMIGVSSAMLPLIGVFFGERDHSNVRTVLRMAQRMGLRIMAPLIVIVCLFSDVISRLFGVTGDAVLAANRIAMPLACIGLLVAYVNILYIGYFTATRHEILANTLVALRLLVYLVILALPLSHIIGVNGIWLSFTLTEIATLLTYFAIQAYLQKKNAALDAYLLDTSQESDDDITFSVRNNIEDIVFASDKISSFCEEHDIPAKKSMRISLAIEEILTVLISQCLSSDKEQYIDIRLYKYGEDVLMRFRYTGKIFDPADYYEKNQNNEAMAEELLGLKMIIKSAQLVDFRQTFGTNNLMLTF